MMLTVFSHLPLEGQDPVKNYNIKIQDRAMFSQNERLLGMNGNLPGIFFFNSPAIKHVL